MSFMTLPENKHLKFILILFYCVLFLAGGYLFLKYLLRYFVPFIISFLLSRIIEPLVSLLNKKCKIPRKIACAICTILAVSILSTLSYIIISRMIYELTILAKEIPALIATFPQKLLEFQGWLGNYFNFSFADEPMHPIAAALNSLLADVRLPVGDIMTYLTSAISSLPFILVGIIATIVATYFMSSDREKISAFFLRQLSPSFSERYARLKNHLTHTLWRWIKAQCLLISITFCELLLGFLILGFESPGIIAGSIALIDALPILGTGTILVPWSLISLLYGDYTQAIGVAIMYVVIAIVRNSIEPKIVGQQIGLHPLITLFSLYFGLQLFGVLGMIILPVVVITIKQFNEWGYIKLWK